MTPRQLVVLPLAAALLACAHSGAEDASERDSEMLRVYDPIPLPEPREEDEREAHARAPVQILTPAELAALEADSLAPPAPRQEQLASLDAPPPAPEPEAVEAAEDVTPPAEEGSDGLPSTLSIRANKKQKCQVKLDGQSLGKAPMRTTEISPGSHKVVLVCKAKKRFATTIDIVAGEHISLQLAGKKLKQKGDRRRAMGAAARAAKPG